MRLFTCVLPSVGQMWSRFSLRSATWYPPSGHDLGPRPGGSSCLPRPAIDPEESHARYLGLLYSAMGTGFPEDVLRGLDESLPVGMQVVSAWLQDRTALCIALRVEPVVGGFEAPPGS